MTGPTCCGDDALLEQLSCDNTGLLCGKLAFRKLQRDLPLPDSDDFELFCTCDNPIPLSKDQTATVLKMIRQIQDDPLKFTDDMVESIIVACAFGAVLRNLFSLFKEAARSRATFVACSHALSILLEWLLKDSSVQATVPLSAVRALESVVQGGIVCLEENFSPSCRQHLLSLWGQPAIVHILDLVLESFKNTGEGAHEQLDCDVILQFFSYLSSNVTLAYPPDMRARLLKIFDEGGVPETQVLEFDHDDSDADSDHSVDVEAGGPSHRRDHTAEYHTLFHRSGAHYPSWPQNSVRGEFKKDSSAHLECSSKDGGCDKQFCGKKDRTGEPDLHSGLYLLGVPSSITLLLLNH